MVASEDETSPELAPRFVHLSLLDDEPEGFVDELESMEGELHDEPVSTQYDVIALESVTERVAPKDTYVSTGA